MSQTRCPICKEPAGRPPDNAFFPFCSDRCKLLDLASWLQGDYAIPAREEDEGDGAAGGETLH